MKVSATLKNVESETCKHIIIRNLSRILDIRIIDIDIENGILHFHYNGKKTFDQVKRELLRIGHPMRSYSSKIDTQMQKINPMIGSKRPLQGPLTRRPY